MLGERVGGDARPVERNQRLYFPTPFHAALKGLSPLLTWRVYGVAWTTHSTLSALSMGSDWSSRLSTSRLDLPFHGVPNDSATTLAPTRPSNVPACEEILPYLLGTSPGR